MAFRDIYRRQAQLLVRILPFIADEDCFALKGGTAINMFVRNMPRLSVDTDLTYLPIASREDSLHAIDAALKRIAQTARSVSPAHDITEVASGNGQVVTKLLAHGDGVQIKIEVTPVLRGSVYEPATRTVSPAVEDEFGFAEIKVQSTADLYGGKIVAALDRQHPRDLFDVRELLAGDGIDDALRRAFVVYLISHNRPTFEVLAPTRKDISQEFERGFEGMTAEPVALDTLLDARESLIAAMVGDMPDEHRRFLISFERGDPDWALLGLDSIADLPAVRWRVLNLDKIAPAARADLVRHLEEVLGQQRTPAA